MIRLFFSEVILNDRLIYDTQAIARANLSHVHQEVIIHLH